jgi:hypothetical protein
MNPETREVIDTTGATKEQLKKLRARGFEPVPPELEEEAKKLLADRKKAKIKPFTPLAKHAKKRRKAKRKQAKLARRKNRGK